MEFWLKQFIVIAAYIIIYFICKYLKTKKNYNIDLTIITALFIWGINTISVRDYQTILEKELARDRAEVSKHIFVSELQFETEFKSYVEIYQELIDLNSNLSILIITIELNDNQPEFLEHIKYNYNKSLTKYRFLLSKNKPFYDKRIYTKFREITFTMDNIAVEFENYKNNLNVNMEKIDENQIIILKKMNELEELIRDRLGEMKIIK
ncbi:hypothetical protein [uncultured Fusobacterium sp.]|jgi:hypothetical protein|uniref:hypothetical protein n=1 Tax=uncultured Fusobacterium sp. TaxID=159267 RepID=UPI0027DD1E06|nr:hypothetical protein [uncultured Fusobacterium sp.]